MTPFKMPIEQQYWVKFLSDELPEPEYIGPFDSYDAAYDYADDENNRLASAGVASWRASYSAL